MTIAINNLTQKVQESLGCITASIDDVVEQSAETQKNNQSAILALSTATISLQLKQIENDFEQPDEVRKRDRWLETYIQWAVKVINDSREKIISDSKTRSRFVLEQELRLSGLIKLAAATIDCQKLTLENLLD